MNATDRGTLYRSYPVLGELSAVLLKTLEETATLVTAPAGTLLFDVGRPCSDYPLLMDGTIRVSKSSPDGHELLLYLLNPGDSCVVSVVALLGETAFPASGTALTSLSLVSIPRSLFMEMVLKSPAFRVFVFRFIALRLSHLMTLVDDITFHRVDQRLASRLLLQEQPSTTTHQMLADELGTSREVVSRILESFQQSGMVRLGRRRIEIVDRSALHEFRQAERD